MMMSRLVVLFVVGVGALSWAGEPTAKLGRNAPLFSLMDQNGKNVSLEDFADKTVVLEWTNPDCPFVVRHYKNETMVDTFDAFKDRGVVWLAVNSTHYYNRDKNGEWAKKHDLPYPILDDRSGKVGLLYGAKTTPHLFIVHRGVLMYDGAIDDDPRGAQESPTNFVASALEAVLSGEKVDRAKNRPYGCSVKYAK